MESVHGATNYAITYTNSQELNVYDYLEGIDEQVLNSIQNISSPIVELEKMSTQGFFSSPENSPSNSHICESR
jgi:uncharacterized protein YbaP (TraB family)